MTEFDTPSLSGPPVIGISATLGLVQRGHVRAVKPRNIVVVNSAPEVVIISRIGSDAIQEKASGVAADGMLEVAGKDHVQLHSGESMTIAVGGRIPSRPGAYVSNVRIHTDLGPPLVLPVTIEIAANPAWGILCMLLGLVLLAGINTLAGESDIRAKLRDVLQFREDANEWLERNPPPASLTATIDAFDLDVQRALVLLAGPRPRSVVDWRISSAQDRQHAAEDELKAIKDAVSRRPLSAAEVADLDDEWQDLQRRIGALGGRDETIPGQTEANLAGRLSAFLASFKNRYLDLSARAEMAALGTQVSLVDLTLASGQREEARRLAVEVRRWLHRAAGDLDERLRLVANYELMASVLLGEDARIRQRLTDSGLPDDTRQSVVRMLDEATARISGATSLPDLKNAFTGVLDVGNRFLKLRSDVMVCQIASNCDPLFASNRDPCEAVGLGLSM